MSVIKPVLRIFDVHKALDFYVDWLGCTVDWEHRYGDNFPVYMQVSLGDIVLHLTEHHGDACPGSKIFIDYTEGLSALHQRLSAKDYKYNKPGPEKAPWGGLCFELTDPFGNRIIFSEQG